MLEGNIPRFPRMTIMPSATMLTRRLTGTTDRSGFYRSTHPESFTSPHPPTAPAGAANRQTRDPRPHFLSPRRGQRSAPALLSRNTGIDSVKENAPDAAIVEVTS